MSRVWVIVGGADKDGILIRQGLEFSSPKADKRLAYSALVQELELKGERLHYRLLHGTGPETGWLSINSGGKNLAVPMLPDSVRGVNPADLAHDPPAMTFYAISDVHVEKKENMQWLRDLPKFNHSTVLVAGDLGVNLVQLKESLQLFQEKFDNVFYCYGNHETWTLKNPMDKHLADYDDSFQKLDALRLLCEELGILTKPALIENVWIVPVLGWYHISWDNEPPLQPPPGEHLSREPLLGTLTATDTQLCNWGGLENGSDALAKLLDEQNERWGSWPLPDELLRDLQAPQGKRKHHVISYSHFLPRIELMPEKRFLFQPGLSQIVGSDYVRSRIATLNPDLHVFGHSHFPWDMTLDDGVRYRSWPLGTPEEQARRIASYPTEHTEQWHPLPVFDSEGRHYQGDEACWFSLMYTRIQREPKSCHMANYVAATYCPKAPLVPDTIISPGMNIQPEAMPDMLRRYKYAQLAFGSVKKQVKGWSNGEADFKSEGDRMKA